MTRTPVILLMALLAPGLSVKAQLLDRLALDSVRTYRGLERALREPDAVYRLDLSGRKLKEVPEEVRRFRNLNHLDLGGNRLKQVPDWLGELQYLQELRISKNRLGGFPSAICALAHLKRLDLSRNAISSLPPCIGGLTELFSLDLWSNDLGDFPEEMAGLTALRFLDLRAIQYDQHEMDRIQDLVPRAKVYFSQPCNCGH